MSKKKKKKKKKNDKMSKKKEEEIECEKIRSDHIRLCLIILDTHT
jgi:hypothetical protein